MSYFDPHGIYFHPQRSSHKGQIITKKPGNGEFAYSEEDFKKAIHIVRDILKMGVYRYPLPLYRIGRQVYTLNLNLNFAFSPSLNSTIVPFSSLLLEFRRFWGNHFKTDFNNFTPVNAALSFYLLSFSGWFTSSIVGHNVTIDSSNLDENLSYVSGAIDSLFFCTYSAEDAIIYYLVDDSSTTTDPGFNTATLRDASRYLTENQLTGLDNVYHLANDTEYEPPESIAEDLVLSMQYKSTQGVLQEFNSVTWLTFFVIFQCVVPIENTFETQNDISMFL